MANLAHAAMQIAHARARFYKALHDNGFEHGKFERRRTLLSAYCPSSQKDFHCNRGHRGQQTQCPLHRIRFLQYRTAVRLAIGHVRPWPRPRHQRCRCLPQPTTRSWMSSWSHCLSSFPSTPEVMHLFFLVLRAVIREKPDWMQCF